MRCPFCNHILHASAYECPSCQLTFPRAKQLLGAVPRLDSAVADTTHRLSAVEKSRIRRRIREIEERFPQLVLQTVIHEFPPEHPLALHVFWLFNAAGIAGDEFRGNDNHSLLIALDPRRGEAAVIPGYGLEPFLGEDALGHLLELAAPAWKAERWADGFTRVLDGLDPWLESIAVEVKSDPPAGGEF